MGVLGFELVLIQEKLNFIPELNGEENEYYKRFHERKQSSATASRTSRHYN